MNLRKLFASNFYVLFVRLVFVYVFCVNIIKNIKQFRVFTSIEINGSAFEEPVIRKVSRQSLLIINTIVKELDEYNSKRT